MIGNDELDLHNCKGGISVHLIVFLFLLLSNFFYYIADIIGFLFFVFSVAICSLKYYLVLCMSFCQHTLDIAFNESVDWQSFPIY